MSVEKLLHPLLDVSDLPDRLSTNFLRGHQVVFVRGREIGVRQVRQRLLNLRREFLVAIRLHQGDDLFDFGSSVGSGLRRRHQSAVFRRGEEIRLGHDGPDADEHHEQNRGHPPAMRGLRLERSTNPATRGGIGRHRRGVRDGCDRERIVPIRQLQCRGKTVFKAKPGIDGDGDRDPVPSASQSDPERRQQRQPADDRSGDPPWPREHGGGSGNQGPDQEGGEAENNRPDQGLEESPQGKSAAGQSNQIIDVLHGMLLQGPERIAPSTGRPIPRRFPVFGN